MEGTRRFAAGRRPFIGAERLDALKDRKIAAQPGKETSFPGCPAASDPKIEFKSGPSETGRTVSKHDKIQYL